MRKIRQSLALLVLLIASAPAAAEPTLVVDVAEKGHRINPTQYGVFFEEISHAGDGGLYAELVKNRSFEDSLKNIPNWSLYEKGNARGKMSLEAKDLLNDAQARALKVALAGAGTLGVVNAGYWGVNVQQGKQYTLRFFAKSALGEGATITAMLQNKDRSAVFAAHTFRNLAPEWKEYSVKLRPNGTEHDGRLVLEISSRRGGAVMLDVVSLFPPTWKCRPNGTRPDLAQMIADLNPGVIRFPGGSYTSTWPEKAPEWLKEIGPVERREGHPAPGEKCNWGYHCTGGFGFHEYLQFAEDLGAEPIYVFQGGADPRAKPDKPKTYIKGEELDELICEILDGIEYANGGTDTEWGAKRAANGHPEPFGMKYVQIGNENWHKPFHANYKKIYRAIKDKYPDIKVIWGGDWIGNNQFGYKSDGVMPPGSKADIIDEHYYKKDDYFFENPDRFSDENYPRDADRQAKIFLGEASALGNDLHAALKEAAFLPGAEKYSDKVVMSVYAPLLCNVNFKKWKANMIFFDNHRAYGTPSYWAQLMLGNHVGDVNVSCSGPDGLLNKSLFVNATMVEDTGEVIVKIVNRDGEQHRIKIHVRGTGADEFAAREITMSARTKKAQNSFEQPENVAPVERAPFAVAGKFDYTVKANSFTVLRLKPAR